MAFFSRSSDFSPLFRLLDDSETHRSRPTPSTSTPASRSTSDDLASRRTRVFSPAFDVRELTDAYCLDGEIPGVDHDNIDIEFSDPHTLIIKGHTERNYQTKPRQTQSGSDSGSPRWRQPTVEDEEEANSNSTDTATVDLTAVSEKLPAENTQSSSFHYWASERSIGDFQRTFTFPTRVNQDAVRASLRNGILSVVVPKEAAPKLKKIRVE